jgi:hypothetical protein
MELNLSCEVTSCTATQELPTILWKPKVNYRVYNHPTVVPILSQMKQDHITPYYLFKINLNIIHPRKSWSSYLPLSSWLSHQ